MQKLSLVFGCGGERDFKKRSLMAIIASKYCKKIYITDDNPRNERPEKIRERNFKNIKNKKFSILEIDQKQLNLQLLMLIQMKSY